jgi:hypothetical protein
MKQTEHKTKPALAGLFFETLVRAFQQGKAVSARRIFEGNTSSMTRKCNAAITALTQLKLHHAAHTTHTAHIRHCWSISFRRFSDHAVCC